MEAPICDYSLELYRSRPAETDENLTLERFPSGTVGFIGKDKATGALDKEVACCVLPGTTMVLSGIHKNVQTLLQIGDREEVVMVRLASDVKHAHRDAVRFHDGRTFTLQALHAGITAQVTGLSPELEAPEAALPQYNLRTPAEAEPVVVADLIR